MMIDVRPLALVLARISASLLAVALLAGCEKTPPPFHRVDGVWHYQKTAIKEADGDTFTALSDHYAKDRARVYYADTYRDGREYYAIAHDRITVIENADASTFRYLDRDYARDATHVYFEGVRHPVKDAATFALQDYGFARDREIGYCHMMPIPGSDGGSFAGIDAHYARDASRIYYCGVEIDDGVRRPYVKAIALPGAQRRVVQDARPRLCDRRPPGLLSRCDRARRRSRDVRGAGRGQRRRRCTRRARGSFERGRRIPP